MKGICKKLVAVTLGITLAIAVFPSGTVRAEDKPKKTAEEEYAFYNQDISAGPWNVSEGVTAYVKAGILYVEGTGAIPDYAADALGTRPWAGQKFQNIWIGDGITEIGSTAFASFSSVINVRIPSTVFIKDATSFGGISSKAAIRISGYNVATKMIGNITYTSAMSIVSWIQNAPQNRVNVDFDLNAKRLFKTQNYPYLVNVVYCVDTRDYINNPLLVDDDFGRPTAPIAKWTSGKTTGYSLKCEKYVPGYNTLVHFSNFLENNTYGAAFKMWAVSPGSQIVNATPGEWTYRLEIPQDLVKENRNFKLICVMDQTTGETVVLDDLDADPATFSFASSKIPYQCALVYRDAETVIEK